MHPALDFCCSVRDLSARRLRGRTWAGSHPEVTCAILPWTAGFKFAAGGVAAATALGFGFGSVTAFASETSVDFKQVRKDIAAILDEDNFDDGSIGSVQHCPRHPAIAVPPHARAPRQACPGTPRVARVRHLRRQVQDRRQRRRDDALHPRGGARRQRRPRGGARPAPQDAHETAPNAPWCCPRVPVPAPWLQRRNSPRAGHPLLSLSPCLLKHYLRCDTKCLCCSHMA